MVLQSSFAKFFRPGRQLFVNDRLANQSPKSHVILSEAAQSAAKSKNPHPAKRTDPSASGFALPSG